MSEINPEFYVYALFIVIFVSMTTILLILKSLKNNDLPFSPLRAYYLYFASGIIGFFVLAAKDGMGLKFELTINIITYIISSYLLLIAVAEFPIRSVAKAVFQSSQLAFFIFSLLLTKFEYQVLFISSYIFSTYIFITYFALRTAKRDNNVGSLIIGVTTLAMVAIGAMQLYLQIVLRDTSFVYYLSVISSATGFLLVGIGVLAQILIRQSKQLTQLAMQDPLTGLLNRRGMESALQLSLSAAKRFDRYISVATLDVDHFKNINDRYGHDAGDAVLVEISKTLISTARKSDLCCRIGGEEFLLVLPDADSKGVIVAAQRVLKKISELRIQRGDYSINITCSIGIATKKGNINLDALLKEGDGALYVAKNNGRNQICTVDGQIVAN